MNVYLSQFNLEYQTGVAKKALYLPYAAGCVWAYANSHTEISENFTLKNILIEKTDPQRLVDSLDDPAVFGFSSYVWNEQFSLHVAKMVKDKFPKCVIVFGGPQVPTAKQEWLEKNKFIDYAVYREGEIVFYNVLKRIMGLEHSTKGMGFLEGGELNHQQAPERISDLAIVPSPYAMGYFDNIVEQYRNTPGVVLNGILETNRGCPFRCTYCDWGGAVASKVKKFEMCRVHEDIEWMAKNQIEWVYLADANFGAFKDRDMDIAKFIVKTKTQHGFPKMFHVGWHKNQGEHLVDIAKLLMDAGMNKEFTASMQSNSPIVLEAIKRKNIGSSVVERMRVLSERNGFKLHTELMAPLPGETYDSMAETFEHCLESDITFSLAPLQILPNSEMNNDIYRQTHGLRTITSMIPEPHVWIKEKEELVVSTNTMTRDEFDKIMSLQFLMTGLHTTGFTDLVAKYYKKTDHVSFTCFYEKMFNFFLGKEQTVLYKYVSPLKDGDPHFGGGNAAKIIMYNEIGQEKREKFFAELKEFCTERLPENPNLNDLIKIQYNWQSHSINGYKTDIECRSNLFDYINNDADLDLSKFTYSVTSDGIKKNFLSMGHFLNFTRATGAWQNKIILKTKQGSL
jgi:putative methyltransferase